MNYISEINSFYNWVMFNPLPPDAQALWHVLMQMNNRCAVNVNDEWYWRVEFSIPNMTLLSILTFSRQQLDRMRNVLIQSGRIMYKKGKGNQSGTYKIIPFDNSVVESCIDNFSDRLWINSKSQYVTQTDTQLDIQNGHKQIHKVDTSENLCNIFGTQINSNNINNKYNNKDDNNKNSALSSVVVCYENNVAPINQIVRDSMIDWLNDVDSDVIIWAINEAVKLNKRYWKYIEGILRNQFNKGNTTMAKITASEKERGNNTKSNSYTSNNNAYDFDGIEKQMWANLKNENTKHDDYSDLFKKFELG